jgi:hypothetical protein
LFIASCGHIVELIHRVILAFKGLSSAIPRLRVIIRPEAANGTGIAFMLGVESSKSAPEAVHLTRIEIGDDYVEKLAYAIRRR